MDDLKWPILNQKLKKNYEEWYSTLPRPLLVGETPSAHTPSHAVPLHKILYTPLPVDILCPIMAVTISFYENCARSSGVAKIENTVKEKNVFSNSHTIQLYRDGGEFTKKYVTSSCRSNCRL